MKMSSKKNDSSVSVDVQVVPQSSRSIIVKGSSTLLKAYLHSPPADGRANRECIKLLSKLFKIPKSAIEIHRGDKSRTKIFMLNGTTTEYVNQTISNL